MTNGNGDGPADASRAFIRKLEESGFFKQIGELEANLRTISDDLKGIGDAATRRLEETESLATHILAVEAVVAAIAATRDVDPAVVDRVVETGIPGLAGKPDAVEVVKRVAREILAKGRG